jgi:hypothetical protein
VVYVKALKKEKRASTAAAIIACEEDGRVSKAEMWSDGV